MFVKFWIVGAVSINSSGQKNDIKKKMYKNVKVLDFGGIINKFFELKNDNLIKNVTKCHFS